MPSIGYTKKTPAEKEFDDLDITDLFLIIEFLMSGQYVKVKKSSRSVLEK